MDAYSNHQAINDNEKLAEEASVMLAKGKDNTVKVYPHNLGEHLNGPHCWDLKSNLLEGFLLGIICNQYVVKIQTRRKDFTEFRRSLGIKVGK